MPRILFATQSYSLPELPISAQRLINMYAERQPPDAKSQVPILGSPGLSDFAMAGTGPIRGIHVMSDILYAVSGREFYQINSDGTSTFLGGDIGGSGPVAMDDNGKQILTVNAAQGFIYAPGGIILTLAQDAAQGDTTLTFLSTSGVSVGDNLQITLENTNIFTTKVTSVSTSGAVGIADPLPSAASGTGSLGTQGTGALATDLDAKFTRITDPNFFSARTVTFFDNYFVLDRMGTSQFFLSNLLDGLSYNPLFFATAEVRSDNVLATVNYMENLLIFGETSIETWYDAGALDFPFQRYDGGTMERGCSAPLTAIKEDNAVFFLGDDLIFYRLQGIYMHRVSTHAIEAAWRSYPTVSDAYAFSYTFRGHKFITLQFPSGDACWVYDITSGLWHERQSWDGQGNLIGRWRGANYAKAYGLDLVGDAYSGRIGKIDPAVFTEYGNIMLSIAVSPPIQNDRKRVFMPRFELDMEAGIGLSLGQGADPQVMLDWSDDQGHTFKAFKPARSFGKIGAYLTRMRWLRLGQFRQRILRVTISDPVRRTIIAAHADLSAGM